MMYLNLGGPTCCYVESENLSMRDRFIKDVALACHEGHTFL